MAIMDFQDIAELLNQSRTTRVELTSTRSKEGRWSIFSGSHTVHTSSYPFKVLYFNSAATVDDIDSATRELGGNDPVHIVYAPSLQTLFKNNAGLPGLRSRAQSIWSTKEYIISFIKEELEAYLTRLRALRPADYTNPRVSTPAGFDRKLPNPVFSFLHDPATESGVGRLGILLAEPGQGKTYMSSYIVSQLARGDYGVIPLLVDSSQWQGLSVSDQRHLTKTIAHSFRHFGAAIGWVDGHEELFLRATLKAEIFRIVFDGFDEYVLHNRGTVQPIEVLEALAELAESTGARIVITSRTSFWNTNIPQTELADFLQEKGAYVFSILPFDRENAKNYFDHRLGDDLAKAKALQTYDILERDSKDLVGRGFVLSLIADLAARGGTSPHPGSDSSRAMLWLVEALCQREIARQDLPFSVNEQLEILRQLATETSVGEKPDTSLLSFILCYVKQTLDSRSTTGVIEKLMSHPLIFKDSSDLWGFRQEQIRILLLADQLVRSTDQDARKFTERAKLSPGARQDLGEMVVELIQLEVDLADRPARIRRLINAISSRSGALESHDSPTNCGARLAAVIALAAVEKMMPAGNSRSDRATMIKDLFGGGRVLGAVFVGTIARYDFSDFEFGNCVFERVTWANCKFNGATKFEGCEFIGGAVPTHCEGLGTVGLVDCRMDIEAESTFKLALIRDGRRSYSLEDLTEDIKAVIDKFIIKGGIGLKTIERRNLSRGTIASSRHRDRIIALIMSRLLEEHHISGPGKGYHVAESAVESIKFYAANNVFIGPLRDLFEELQTELGL
jgi:hypothetical protein